MQVPLTGNLRGTCRRTRRLSAYVGMPDNLTELLDVHQAAERLNVSERFIRRIVAERRIAVHRIGRHVRLRADDIEAFIASARQESCRRRPW